MPIQKTTSSSSSVNRVYNFCNRSRRWALATGFVLTFTFPLTECAAASVAVSAKASLVKANMAKANAAAVHASIEAFETLTEHTQKLNDASFNKLSAIIETAGPAVAMVLGSAENAKFSALSAASTTAWHAKNLTALSINAAEAFRVLTENAPAGAVPNEVGLLDYVGFRIKALTAARSPAQLAPDWTAIQSTVFDADKWWAAVKARVTDHNVRSAQTRVLKGMHEAVEKHDLALLNFAADMDLILVDSLEVNFGELPLGIGK